MATEHNFKVKKGLDVLGGDVNLGDGFAYKIDGTTVVDSSRNLTNIGSISSGAITGSSLTVSTSGTPTLTLYDTGNGGAGSASAKIKLKNTDGIVAGIGYTGDLTTDTDLIISTNAAGTYGGYLDLDAAALADAQSDIILEPKTNVRIATGGLKIGTTTFVDSSRNITAGTISTSGKTSIAASASTSSSASLKLHVGTINNTGSSAIAQFGGFIRASEYYILHASTGSTDSLFIDYVGDDMDITDGEGSYSGVLRANGYKVGTTTVIDSSRNLSNIGSLALSSSITLNNNQKIYFKNSSGTSNSFIYRAGGDATRFEYADNVFIFDAASDTDFEIRNSSDAVVFKVDVGATAGDTSVYSAGNVNAGSIQTASTTRITSSGNLTNIGSISSGAITSSGNITTSGTITASGTNSSTAPRFRFEGDTDTGLASVSANAVGLIAGGSRKFYVNETTAYFQNLTGGVTMDRLTVNTDATNEVLITATDSTANTAFNAVKIDHNISGSDATTGDRQHIGLFVDVDSSATGGDTSNEHRIYGVYADVQTSGDSDLMYGGYFHSRANNFTGTISHLRGVYGLGVAHNNTGTITNTVGGYNYGQNYTSGTGETNQIYGSYNQAYASSTSSYASSNYYGSWSIAQVGANQTANINAVTGVYGEVQLDNNTVGTPTIDTAYVFRAEYDENDSDDSYTVNTGYLFYGNYAGTQPTTAYGIYIADVVTSYFNGYVRTSTGYQVGTTTVIDNGRNLTNIGTISSGAITTSGDITVSGNQVFTSGSDARVKFAVWSNDIYGIGMTSGATYGGINNDYAMTFQMNNDADRGWLFLDSDDTLAQGAMGITTTGKVTIADAVRIGFGKGDTTAPASSTAMLNVNGTTRVTNSEFQITSSNSYMTHLNYQDSGQNYISQATSGGLTQFRNSSEALMEIASSGNVTITNNLTVGGNLVVNGTTTTINTANLNVEDNNITLNYGTGSTVATANGSGITIQDAMAENHDATILWDTSNDRFNFSDPINVGIVGLNQQPGTDSLNVAGYGIIGNRTAVYLTNANSSGTVQIGVGGAHNANPKLTIGSSDATFATHISSTGNIVAAGELDGATLDISGNAAIGGYLNFDGGSQNGLIRFNGNNAIGYSNNFLYINASNQFTSGVYINSSLKVDTGLIGSYNEDLQLRTANTTALTLSNANQDATFAGNIRTDGYLRFGRGSEEIGIIFEDSATNDSIYHTINDGQGNYNIMLGVNGAGTTTAAGDGQAKIMLTGHSTSGGVSLNAGPTVANAGTTANYSIGLLVDGSDNTIRVGNPNNSTGLTPGGGYTKVFDNSGNAFASTFTATTGVQLGAGHNLTWGGVYASNFPAIAANSSGSSGFVNVYPGGASTGAVLHVDSGGADIKGRLRVIAPSGGHITFELGSRDADPAPTATGSYDFKPGMRVIASDGTAGDGVDADDDIIFAWNDDDHTSSSEGYLAGTQTYATASFSKTFNITSATGARFFAKVKMNDAESGNDPRIAVNGGTEYKLEYGDAPNAAGEAVNDADSWHVIDITDDVGTGSNTFKAWLAAGQKTYIIAVYIFKSTGIMLPNEPYESVAYSHKGFGVGDTRIVTEGRNLINIGTISSGGITTSGILDFTSATSTIRNQEDNSGQIAIQVKDSSGTAREVRWDAGNNVNGAWRATTNGAADLGLTNKIWNNLFVNTIKMGTGNVEVIDSSRNISAANITATKYGFADTEHHLTFKSTSLISGATTDTTEVLGRQIDLYAYDDILLRAGTGDKIKLVAQGADRFQVDTNTSILAGDLKMGTNTVIDSSRNITAGTISSGTVTSSGNFVATSGYVNTANQYLNGTVRVLNSAGDGWNVFASRTSGGIFDISSVGNFTSTGILTHENVNTGATRSTYGIAVFESTDAHVDITSDSAGTWGSSLLLREAHSSAYRNAWAISRKTGTAPDLVFNFGTAADHNINGTKFTFASNGKFTAGTSSVAGSLVANYANDGTMTLEGYGLVMNRVSSYIRPSTDGNKYLYIGGADASLDWLAIHFRSVNGLYMSGTQFLTSSRVLNNIAGITSSGTHTFTSNDVDFVVQDTTDSVTNFIWRDHSGSTLYLGTQDAVVNLRSALKINNTTRIDMSGNATLGTISSGVISASGGVHTFGGGSSDYAAKFTSTDAYAGIMFQDTDSSTVMYYRGATDKLYLNSADFAVNGSTLASGSNFQVNGVANVTSGLKMNNVEVITADRVLDNITGLDLDAPAGAHQPVTLTFTDNISNQTTTGIFIDYNASGSQAHTADNAHRALQIDFDSSATGGDTSNEHRLYGIDVNVRATGDSDIVYGIYGYAEGQNSAGQISDVIGIYGYAVSDEVTDGKISNIKGVQGLAYLYGQGSQTSATAYAGYFKTLATTAQDKNTSSLHGVYAEVEMDDPGQAQTVSNVYAYRAEIDNDGGSNLTINNGYLFYGNYAGTHPTNAFGVYIPDTVKNYFAGEMDIRQDVFIGSSSDAARYIYIDKATSGENGIIFRNGGANKARIIQDSSEHLRFKTNNNNIRMSILENGDVGVGASNPAAAFHVYNPYDVTSNTDKAGILLSRVSDTQRWLLSAGVSGVSNSYFAIRDVTGGAYRLVIDDSGSVLFGKSTTDLNTAGTTINAGGVAGKVQISRSSSPLTLNNTTDNGNSLNVYKGSSFIGGLGIEGGDSLYIQAGTTTGSGLRMHPSSGVISPVRNGALSSNTISLGTSTQAFKDAHFAGKVYANDIDIGGVILDSSDNLDALTDGFYKWSSSLPSNNPSSVQYMNMLQMTDPNQKIQLAWGGSSSGRMFVRRADSGTFYSWTEFFSTAHVPTLAEVTGSGNTSAVDINTSNSIQTGGVSRISSGGNLTNIGSITANSTIQTTGTILEVGLNSGAVALTTNDGYGNANLCFNHTSGVPDVSGAACRIETNVDSSTYGVFTFEASSAAVTANTAVNLATLGTWSTQGFTTNYKVLAPTGGAASPSFSFIDDANTGMFSNGADNIGFATNGINRVNISNTKLLLQDGVGLDLETSSGNVRGQILASETAPNLRIATSSGESIGFYDAGTSGTCNLEIDGGGSVVVRGNITAYGSPSDINLKENIQTIPNAVEKVQKLEGVTFNYKKDGGRSTGLIAQQLQEVLPEVVYTAKDLEGEEHLAVRYGNVVGLLVEAIKEQQTQLTAQQEQINQLTILVNKLMEK